MHYSLPGSSVYGIFQARILGWVAISFSRGSSQPRDWTQVSHIAGRLFTIWVTGVWTNVWQPMVFPYGTNGNEPACQCRRCETQVWFLGQEDYLGEGVATHSNILAWRIPWTEEEPGELRSIGSQRIGHDCSDLACMHACMMTYMHHYRIIQSIVLC